jgi:hypothetical protein
VRDGPPAQGLGHGADAAQQQGGQDRAMSRFDAFAEVLQGRAREGESAVQLGLLLADLAGDGFEPMTFVATFHQAFGIPIQVLLESASWVGYGFDDVKDEDFGAQLDPYVNSWRKGGG